MTSPGDTPPIVAVVGFTASGKTGLSLDLAEALGGEIVNTDAMQVYRGMDIGTAKLPVDERRGIRHHLLDLLDVTEPLTVADFQARARAVIAQLRGNGTLPVLVGGSALYTRAILDRFEFPGTDEAVRATLGGRARRGRIGRAAPTADRGWTPTLPPGSSRTTGAGSSGRSRSSSSPALPYSANLPTLEYADPATVQVGLAIDRPTLDQRIEQRVDQMFAAGLVDEVQRLLEQGLAEGRTASRAIGYREVAAYLAGELTLDEAEERTVIATRQFARRQDSWWRKDERIRWVPYDAPDRVEQAIAAVRG